MWPFFLGIIYFSILLIFFPFFFPNIFITIFSSSRSQRYFIIHLYFSLKMKVCSFTTNIFLSILFFVMPCGLGLENSTFIHNKVFNRSQKQVSSV